MKTRTLPNGQAIPILGFGTWRLGGSMKPDTSHDEQVIQALETAIELGYTHLDTAEMYGGGHTEELVGQAIRKFDRSQLQIGTKIWHTNLRYDSVFRALEGSLKRLGIDYVDYYVIHLPSAHIPMEDTFRALNELVSGGQVRHLGVSNFTVAQLQQAIALSKTPICMSQAPCSLYNRKFIKNGLLEFCQKNRIIMAAYSPFERGDLLDHPLVHDLAKKYEASPAQIALNWLTQQEQVIVYLTSLSRAHLQENLAALELDLAPEDVELLNHIEMPEEKLWPQ